MASRRPNKNGPRGRASPSARLQDRYSALDRLLHRLAFRCLGLQKSLADLEDRLYRRRLRGVRIERPVFIAALPRCGTTLMLETLRALGDFAAHTYRHMPFVLTPLLWGEVWRRVQMANREVERAHGDGMAVGFDSAEAFEEIAWRAFWPAKYAGGRIEPWSEEDRDAGGEFEAFFKSHVAKLIAMRAAERNRAAEKSRVAQKSRGAASPLQMAGSPLRYLSKNNANIARIPILLKLFPEATVLVAFRRPLDQAGSMLAQHLRFRAIHDREPFTLRYMADVGHDEFGRNHRPIAFDGFINAFHDLGGVGSNGGDRETATPPGDSIDYWLSYWCAAYEHMLAQPPSGIVLVDYDALCADPASGLPKLAAAAGIPGPRDLGQAAARFRAPNRYDPKKLRPNTELLARAQDIHHRLSGRAARPAPT